MDIKLTAHRDFPGWVEIANNGGPKVFHFLQANSKHFDRMMFRSEYGLDGQLALKADRIPKFIAHAAKSGLVASF